MSYILENWPLTFVCAAMIVAAIIDGVKLKVPNWLTFPLIISGWLLGILHNFELLQSTGVGGIGASLAGTALGFGLLFPVYAIGGMGAGDVKMQMGFGAWIGSFYGLPTALNVIFWAFVVAVLLGGIIALGMIAFRKKFRQNLSNTREILGDLFSGKGIDSITSKAKERKSRLHLLPYGIPLCLGFVGYLAYLNW